MSYSASNTMRYIFNRLFSVFHFARWDHTPMDDAKIFGHNDVVKFLQERKAKAKGDNRKWRNMAHFHCTLNPYSGCEIISACYYKIEQNRASMVLAVKITKLYWGTIGNGLTDWWRHSGINDVIRRVAMEILIPLNCCTKLVWTDTMWGGVLRSVLLVYIGYSFSWRWPPFSCYDEFCVFLYTCVGLSYQ